MPLDNRVVDVHHSTVMGLQWHPVNISSVGVGAVLCASMEIASIESPLNRHHRLCQQAVVAVFAADCTMCCWLQATAWASKMQGNDVLFMMGSDFQHANAHASFVNLDR